MAIILDGKAVSARIRAQVKAKASELGVRPGLAAILVGDDPASKLYVEMKAKACQEAGFHSLIEFLPETVGEGEVLDTIESFNQDDTIHGILVQLPLPKGIGRAGVFSAINPRKDVDGFHPRNMGALMAGDETLVAATPKGVVRLVEEYKIPFEGREAVIVNHSTVIGRPLSMLLLNRGATVTVCHVKTRDLKAHTLKADILVSGAGVPGLIRPDMVKEGAVVVDVGTSKRGERTVGDVYFEGVKAKASHISPVPGGVGPMTIAMLLENTLHAACRK
jgi:methylenetetrahydrofolate dehydrogenase (NADP+) / methenyltetrahydrofolate cyclohydrolase